MALQAETNDRLETNKIIGSRIREARKEKDMTQEGLAETIKNNIGSCSRQAVAQWERGSAMPSYSMMPELARALGVSPAWLSFGVTGTNNKASVRASDQAAQTIRINHVQFGQSLDARKIVAQWGVPKTAFALLDGAGRNDVIITEVNSKVVAGKYESGDLVYINTHDKRPDGGVIAYWDGMGIAFAFAAVIPSKANPKIHLTGQNLDFSTDLDDIEIIGKVIGNIRMGA